MEKHKLQQRSKFRVSLEIKSDGTTTFVTVNRFRELDLK